MLSFGFTALYCGFGGILVLCLPRTGRATERSAFRLKIVVAEFLAYVGMHSYSIYLWHLMVGQHVRGFLRIFVPKITPSGVFCGYVITSLTVGVFLSKLIEYPALAVRDRLFPSKLNSPR